MDTMQKRDTAATILQKVIRGHNARDKLGQEILETNATKIQKVIRGHKERKQVDTLQKTKKRAEKIAKGQEILDQMRYNQYLKEEPVRAFGELSRGALTKQRKAIQQQ